MKAEQLELPFEEPVVAPVLPVTAFLVVVDEHGGRRPPALTTPLKVERQANLADIRRGCMEVVADVACHQLEDTVMMQLNLKPPTQAE